MTKQSESDWGSFRGCAISSSLGRHSKYITISEGGTWHSGQSKSANSAYRCLRYDYTEGNLLTCSVVVVNGCKDTL